MSSTASSPDPHRQALDELVDMGMDLARAVHRNAMSDPASPPTDATVARFDRLARTVRRTVLLARRLDAMPPGAMHLAHLRRTEDRARVIRTVEDAINREHGETERADRLRDELAERLDGTELNEAWGLRPMADLIADIRHDLGLDVAPGTRPWCRRTPAEVRDLRRRAAQPPPTPAGRMGEAPCAATPLPPGTVPRPAPA